MIENLADIILRAAEKSPDSEALRHRHAGRTYGDLAADVLDFASALQSLDLRRQERVAVLAGKRVETVVAGFGAVAAGATFVPINTLLKPRQIAYIMADCNVRVLVTTASRVGELTPTFAECADLEHVIAIDLDGREFDTGRVTLHEWSAFRQRAGSARRPRSIASDMAAIMYTSGSTGQPKGVVLSHANMTIGAASVAHYLGNDASDVILAVLPFSFDAGLSQLTTGFHSGACVLLHDYLLPRDVVKLIDSESVTGITGVPPLWMQLAEQSWDGIRTDSVRYFANTGGKMPRATLARLREIFPAARPFLMYGLTEAFRSTYLPPSEVDNRPDSIGKAIPNAEVMVVREDGSPCTPGETGELVHRGPLVSLGYWNDPERTARRFRPAPGRPGEIPVAELAVFSGDSVRTDDDGFLYFVGRMDDMIKTSGYRVSPAEIEEVAYDSGLVAEVAALGIDHPRLGQGIVLVAKGSDGRNAQTDELLAFIRPIVPNYMVPAAVVWRDSLPRNANGKLDRKALAADLTTLFQD